jgi:pyruvate,water dikinase
MMIARSPEGTEEVIVPEIKRNKQKLSDQQIGELAEICQNIEKHYKKPQDIEWALEKGKFYIVQSRPITTLG